MPPSPFSWVTRASSDFWRSRNQPFLVALLLFNSIILLHHHLAASSPTPSSSRIAFSNTSISSNPATASCEVCIATPDDPLCAEYGSTNVRLSRAYQGSGYRVRRFLEKAMRGEEVRIGVIGASVSLGHGLNGAPTWHAVFLAGFKAMFPLAKIYDGSAAAMDSALGLASELARGGGGELISELPQASSTPSAPGPCFPWIWIYILLSWCVFSYSDMLPSALTSHPAGYQ